MSNNTELQTALFHYLLRLGDDRLILGQRLSEWSGHAPILEEDIALSNITLDMIGQASALLGYAGEVEGAGRTDDDLAYRRSEMEYTNSLITEQPNGDFAVTIIRQFLFDTYAYFLFSELKNSSDEKLAGIAGKSIKEITYHRRHSSQWVLRLGDGTEESHNRAQTALNNLWIYTGDIFATIDGDSILAEAGIMPEISKIKDLWFESITTVITKATLEMPPADTYMQTGSRQGRHTEHLGYLLAEMQYLTNRFPDAKW